ncbi:efflux RND transporter permease subunit, partial [Acinetobacter baumannii]
VSLTLVPMLCSRFLRHHEPQEEGALGRSFERGFQWVLGRYTTTLDWALAHRGFVLLVGAGTFVLTAVLFVVIPKGFFPEEDVGQIQVT